MLIVKEDVAMKKRWIIIGIILSVVGSFVGAFLAIRYYRKKDNALLAYETISYDEESDEPIGI